MTIENLLRREGTKTIERDAHVKDEQNIPVTQDTISPETTGDVTLGEVAGEVAGDTTNAPVDELSGEGPLYRVIYRYAFRSNKPFWVLTRRVIKTIRARWFAPPTKEQLTIKSLKRQRRSEKKMLTNEATAILKLFRNEFLNHGLYFQRKDGKKRNVRFLKTTSSIEAHYIRVDTHRRPEGVHISHLVDDDLLKDLSVDVGRPVSVRYGEDIKGVVYRVDRGGARAGVPEHVMYTEVLDRFPASADGLQIGFGLAQNGKLVSWSLASMPHLVIAGTSGFGKSNFIKSLTGTFLRRNSPDRLRLMLIDVKRTDLKIFAGVPHLIELEGITDQRSKGIVKDKEKVLPALRWLQDEMERRFKLLDECDDDLVSNISQYNQKYRNKRLPRIVLIFDEFGAMRDQNKVGDESKVGDAVESVLANLVEMGRSAGIHCILATQTATTKVICGRIKNNAGAKLAFNCSNIEGSKAILGNGGAVNLFTKGRAILDFNRTVEVQTPKMTDDILMETIEGAKTGQFQALQARHDVTPQEVMQYALEKHSGKLALQGDNGIYTFFRSRGISRDELAEWFESWEGNEYVVNDVLYKVSPNSGSQPRRLVAVEVDNKTI